MTLAAEPHPTREEGISQSETFRAPRQSWRVALLGSGYISDWHARAIGSIENVRLSAICDRIPARAEALAQKSKLAKAYTSLADMLAGEKPDAVHILLPPDCHFEAARTVLEAGADVFIEKPMCIRSAECDLLTALARKRNQRIGVGHNFLFSPAYERLRQDVADGKLGRIDQLEVIWNRELPPALHGPYGSWMFRDPCNIMLEVGPHPVSFVLDLLGEPDRIHVLPSNPQVLPSGQPFYRRWRVSALCGLSSIDLHFSFIPGFAEFSVHVRGTLASATADLERNTYSCRRHLARSSDFENYSMLCAEARDLKRQARSTLTRYFRSKLDLGVRGTPYGLTIAKAIDAFYHPANQDLDDRISASMGARVIRACEKIAALADLEPSEAVTGGRTLSPEPPPRLQTPQSRIQPRILVLGGTGFIGKELVRQLVERGYAVRLLTRHPDNLPVGLRGSQLEIRRGDLNNPEEIRSALEGIDCIFHLAKANVKTWSDYKELDIAATKRLAECAMDAGVKRFIYTGTIASYYQGAHAGTISENTPLDLRIAQSNLYSRSKTVSEKLLMEMHRAQGLPVVILRPGIVIGRGGSPFHWGVGMWWYDAVCQTWGPGNHKLPFVLVEDVASGLIAAMEKPGLEGRSFNLVGDPCLSAQEYLDELDRLGRFRIQRLPTPIVRFYLDDLIRWAAKVALRYPDRRFPSYREWETRTLRAQFDCSAAKQVLDWRPETNREEFVRKGIEAPVNEFTR